jgi:cytosine/adenosine deaminase-related metal-dependent hydrolase
VLDDWGWVGPDVWVAHGIWFDDTEVARLGHAGAGVAHCPSSNARLAAGMCRVRDLREAGVHVGLGVDGVASNEIGTLFPEVRQALFVARLRSLDATSFDHLDALEVATTGGANCLGRSDLGRLEVGATADLAFWPVSDLDDIEDPLVGLVFGPDRRVDRLVVGGRTVVEAGALNGVDLADAHRRLAIRARRLWAAE